jgi:hypothetical protein
MNSCSRAILPLAQRATDMRPGACSMRALEKKSCTFVRVCHLKTAVEQAIATARHE